MSILIRGMKMPRVCAECFMDPPCCKALSGDINIWKERHPDCPLVEVKEPHGRMIDAESLEEILTTAIRNMKGVAKFLGVEDDPEIKMETKAYTDILNGVKEQPTIIEAEGSDT